MKITYKCDYALKAVFELAVRYKEGESEIVSIQELSKVGDMPTKFLEHILLSLKKGGFVKSKRGIRGGFILGRSPSTITVGEVVRFIEGPVEPIACAADKHYRGCRDTGACIFREVWSEVHDAVTSIIDELTFEELVRRFRARSIGAKSMEYSI